MWKSLGCGLFCWKLFCGLLVEDEGFNKWVWQCVWSQITLELRPFLCCRRNAADFQILIKYAFSLLITLLLSSSGHYSRDEFTLAVMVLGMFLGRNHWLGQVFSCLTPLTFEVELLSHFLLFLSHLSCVCLVLNQLAKSWTHYLNRNVLFIQIDSIHGRFSG